MGWVGNGSWGIEKRRQKRKKKVRKMLFSFCLSVGRLLSINNMIGLGTLEKYDIQLWLQNSIYFVFDEMDVYMEYMELIDNQNVFFFFIHFCFIFRLK